jgi:hypothetical protein
LHLRLRRSEFPRRIIFLAFGGLYIGFAVDDESDIGYMIWEWRARSLT